MKSGSSKHRCVLSLIYILTQANSTLHQYKELKTQINSEVWFTALPPDHMTNTQFQIEDSAAAQASTEVCRLQEASQREVELTESRLMQVKTELSTSTALLEDARTQLQQLKTDGGARRSVLLGRQAQLLGPRGASDS